VIRREFRFAEGDPYNTSKLARTEQRLNNLGFFEKVAVTQKRGSAPDQTVVDVDVQEQSTGEISVGAGFSTVDGPLADFGITERNLLGKGQELRFKTLLASRRQQYDIGFTEPYFLDRELAAGFDLFKTLQDFSRESAFDRESTGGALRLGYALNENLNHDMYYRFENINITNVNDQASRFIKDQAGTNVSSLVGQALTWDKRNNRFEPTDGWYVRLSQEFAGVGGDSRFARHEIKAVDYFPIAPQWTFQLAATGGNIAGIGRDVRINERFFIGGRQLRGFEVGGIGPRDRNTRDALGGNLYYTGSAELQFPLGLPDDLGFSGAVFTDVGSLWSLDVNDPGIVESNTPRVTSGVGIAWKSPFGPIRLDFAKPIVKQDEDVAQFFNINFGTRF
jgi:outer membrane protein insertion porin family